MAAILVSQETKERWALVGEEEREILMLEFSHQTMKGVKSIQTIILIFFALVFLGGCATLLVAL